MSEVDRSRLKTYKEALHYLEQIRRDVEEIRVEAIRELIQQRKKIATELRSLGHNEQTARQFDRKTEDLPDTPNMVGLNGRRRPGSKPAHESRCVICQIDGHDGRAHSRQDPKRPFTRDELKKRGLPAPINGNSPSPDDGQTASSPFANQPRRRKRRPRGERLPV
jgi:hypothetical protein